MRKIRSTIAVLIAAAMLMSVLPMEIFAANLKEKSIVSSTYNIPMDVLNTRPAEEVHELFSGIPSITSVGTVYYEYVYDEDGLATSFERTEADYQNYLERQNNPDLAQINESGPSPTSWMSITLVTQDVGTHNWHSRITAYYNWLVQPTAIYNSLDMISLTWDNGYYVNNSASGYSSSFYNGSQHSESIEVVRPESNVINFLESMSKYDSRSNIFFCLTAEIRKVYSEGDESIFAVYGHQKLNITWQDVLSLGWNAAQIAMYFYAEGAAGYYYITDNVASILWTLGTIENKYDITNKSRTISLNENSNLAKIERFVIRLYTKCLERQPDVSGLDSWVTALYYNGSRGSTVAHGFFFSTEYENLGKSNTEYVTDLYEVLLDRNPDSSGLSNWVSYLNAGYTREYIFNKFTISEEFQMLCSNYGITP